MTSSLGPKRPRGRIARRVDPIRAWMERLYVRANRRLRGYPALIYRAIFAFGDHEGGAMAASLAYYALFSFFPLLLLVIAVGSSFLSVTDVKEMALGVVSRFVPVATELASTNVEEILRQRGAISVVAALSLLWSSSGVFGAIFRSLNAAWGDMRPPPAWEGRLVGILLTVVIGLLFFVNMALMAAMAVVQTWRLPVLGWQVFLDPGVTRLMGWLSVLGSLAISIAVFSFMYRTLPRAHVDWRDVWPGGIAAGLAWQLARVLFTAYLRFAKYNLVYGSVGTIAAFLLWAYLTALILLLGADFTAQYAHWRDAGRPIDDRLPRQIREEFS